MILQRGHVCNDNSAYGQRAETCTTVCSVCNIQRKAAKDYDKYKTDQIPQATLAALRLHISSINCLNDGAPRYTDVNGRQRRQRRDNDGLWIAGWSTNKWKMKV